MSARAQWEAAQEWEAAWWGSEPAWHWVLEQQKQRVYATLMGMPADLDFGERRILDVGCGPVSLLRVAKHGPSVGVEPLPLPASVLATYAEHGVIIMQTRGEDLQVTGFDEAWCYNVLQHVEYPGAVLANLADAAPVVRCFEWLNTPPSPGHPWTLRAALFEESFRGWRRVTWKTGTLADSLTHGDYIALTVERPMI